MKTDLTPASPSGRNLGVFAANRSRPVHRWYPFVEGYSSELVEWGLRESPDPKPRILDPFGGSGTTALAAAEHSLASSFCEINPFLAWLADVKVNQTQRVSLPEGTQNLQILLRRLKRDRIPKLSTPSESPLVSVDAKRDYFPPDVAAQVSRLMTWLDQETEGAERELGRAAVAVTLVPCSNMIRRTDLRRRTGTDPSPRPLIPTLIASLEMVLEDLGCVSRKWSVSSNRIAEDVRTLTIPAKEKFDLVITSPPYLNGTNYCRNTKLELLALGFIDGESGLSRFRSESITAGINSVTRSRKGPELFDEVEAVARELDACAYDKRIPTLVRLYFSDMGASLKAIRNACRSGALMLLDIGDSRFAGVHVPTHELLATIASDVGWKRAETIPIRARKSYDGSQLVQVVLRLEAV